MSPERRLKHDETSIKVRILGHAEDIVGNIVQNMVKIVVFIKERFFCDEQSVNKIVDAVPANENSRKTT